MLALVNPETIDFDRRILIDFDRRILCDLALSLNGLVDSSRCTMSDVSKIPAALSEEGGAIDCRRILCEAERMRIDEEREECWFDEFDAVSSNVSVLA